MENMIHRDMSQFQLELFAQLPVESATITPPTLSTDVIGIC